jgi:hypothetical protein
VHHLSYWFATQQVQSERYRQEGEITETRTFAPALRRRIAVESSELGRRCAPAQVLAMACGFPGV